MKTGFYNVTISLFLVMAIFGLILTLGKVADGEWGAAGISFFSSVFALVLLKNYLRNKKPNTNKPEKEK